MEIFSEECYGKDYKNNKLFTEWHDAVKNDLNIFKIILEQYDDSKEKDKLLTTIDYIRKNISNKFNDEEFVVMKSTNEYFLFSFYDNITSDRIIDSIEDMDFYMDNDITVSDMPTYVLLSRDYKRILIAREEMECFDDEEFDENERYGLYNYDYFFLNDNKVKHYNECLKEYTYVFTSKFYGSGFYEKDIKEAEIYCDYLLNEQNVVKKLIP